MRRRTPCMNTMSKPEISTSAVDRISSLPDDILIHILSCVSTKQAFATSILSKRWTHPWCFVPDLDFSDIRRQDLMMILEKCPVLEDLQLSDISFQSTFCCKSSENLRKLNRANITECRCYIPMKALSNVEYLRIQLSKAYHPYDFPTFNNLTHLVLNYDWDIVVQVLLHCPKLQNLELYQKTQQACYYWMEEENWAHPKFVPSCLSSKLTTCTMRDFAFAGQQRNHIMLARFIMENARVLETITIWCSNNQSEIESQLSPCPRASEICQLCFEKKLSLNDLDFTCTIFLKNWF